MDETHVPIRLDGETRGELSVTGEGLLTRFDARCADPGRLVRLSVYGEGREGYLGVMEPENGALSLHRKLSRAERADFPERIEYAAEAGETKTASKGARPAPQSVPQNAPRRGAGRAQSREGDTLWRQVGDGSLYAETPQGSFRAIPAARYGLPSKNAADRRVIEGVEYIIYRLHGGRIE